MTTQDETRQVGSFGIWLLKFLIPLFWLGLGTTMIVSLGRISWRAVLFVLLLVIASGLATDSMAYGCAGEKGVWYRRWIKRDFLAWEKVAFVAWFPSILTVYPKETTLLRAKVDFPIASLPWHAIVQIWGGATPEVVRWFEQQANIGRPGFPELRIGYHAWKATFPWKATLPIWVSLLLFLLAFLVIRST